MTSYIDVKVAGKKAEVCAQYLHKGARVMVDGRLRQESWIKDDVKHSRIVIFGDQVEFGPAAGGAGRDNDQGPQAPATEAAAVQDALAEDDGLPF